MRTHIGWMAVAIMINASSGAGAAEWDVSVGGEFIAIVGVGVVDIETVPEADFDGVDVYQEAKIFFAADLTLDNGLTFGAEVELEGVTDDEQIGDSFMSIDGEFGRVEIGSRTSAGYTMSYASPDVSLIGINDGNAGAFVPFDGEAGDRLTGSDLGVGTLNSTFIENGGNDGAQRITYFTPRVAGIQFGASYARDPLKNSSEAVNLDGDPLNNIFDVGLNYVATVGSVDVGVSGRWGVAQNDAAGSDTPQIYAFGTTVGFGGISVGGSFAEQNGAGVSDGTAFDIGVAYESGSWQASVTYLRGENVDDEAPVPGSDETLDQVIGGVNYALASGIALGAYAGYVMFDEDVGDDGGRGDDVDGFIAGAGVVLEF